MKVILKNIFNCYGANMRLKKVFDIVSIIIGTIVGAGFATGNEIYQFFARYGYFGYVLVCIFFLGTFSLTNSSTNQSLHIHFIVG